MTEQANLAQIARLRQIALTLVAELDKMRDSLTTAVRARAGKPDHVLAVVATVTGLDPQVVVGPSRMHLVVKARAVVCLVLRDAGLSYPEIGRCIGRDHTTAMNACKIAKRAMFEGPLAEMLTRAYDQGLATWKCGTLT